MYTKTWILFSPGTIAGKEGYNYKKQTTLNNYTKHTLSIRALVEYLPWVQED